MSLLEAGFLGDFWFAYSDERATPWPERKKTRNPLRTTSDFTTLDSTRPQCTRKVYCTQVGMELPDYLVSEKMVCTINCATLKPPWHVSSHYQTHQTAQTMPQPTTSRSRNVKRKWLLKTTSSFYSFSCYPSEFSQAWKFASLLSGIYLLAAE